VTLKANYDNDEIWPILATMRFVFAMWVLFDHTYNFGPHSRAMPILSSSGLMPVMCFLAISGYSIRHSIEAQPDGYLKRRFWRIAPTNFASVALAISAYSVLGPVLIDGYGNQFQKPDVFSWIIYLIPAQSVFPVFIPVLFPTWSLSIEIMYYILAPWLLRASTKTLLGIVLFSAAGFACWNYLPAGFAPRYVAEATTGVGIAVFAWAWLSGWMAYKRKDPIFFIVFWSIGCVCVFQQPYGFQLNDATSKVATYVTWLATMATLFFPMHFGLSPRVRKIMSYIGDLSFPLYLVQYPVLFALTSSVWKAHPDWNFGVLHVLISIVAAVLVLHLCDRPFRRFGRSKTVAQSTMSHGIS